MNTAPRRESTRIARQAAPNGFFPRADEILVSKYVLPFKQQWFLDDTILGVSGWD